MTGKDWVKLVRIKDTRFDELEDAGEIFGAAKLEREGDQVLGGHDPSGNRIYLGLDGLRESLLAQAVARGKELDLPSFDDDVCPFGLAAASGEILVNRAKAEQGCAVARFEGYEDINIQSGRRLKVEGCAHRSANSVSADDTVGLHLVDDCQSGFHGYPVFSMTPRSGTALRLVAQGVVH